MGNDAIKNAILKYLKEEKSLEVGDVSHLKEEVDKVKNFRNNLDDLLLKTKINIINSSTHLLIDKIYKDEKEGVLKILENTKDRIVFYDFLDSLNDLLITYENYHKNYHEESPELLGLKETFALNDHQLNDLITEINLDNK